MQNLLSKVNSTASKLLSALAVALMFAPAAFAQTATGISGVVSSAASDAQTEFEAIIAAVAPVCFVVIVAVVAIGVGLKLFRKAQ